MLESVAINAESIPGKHVIEAGGKRFHVSTTVALKFLDTARKNGGWSHLGGFFINTAGIVISPEFELDAIPETITITDQQYEAVGAAIESFFT